MRHPRDLIQWSHILLKKTILSFKIIERRSFTIIQDNLDFIKLNWIIGDLHDLAKVILAAKKMNVMSLLVCPEVPST